MKTLTELYKMANGKKDLYINKKRAEYDADCIRKLADSAMSLSKAKNSEDRLMALSDINYYLQLIKTELEVYRDQLGIVRAEKSVFTEYIDSINSALKDI